MRRILVTWFLLLAVVPMSIMGWLSYEQNSQYLRKLIDNYLYEVSLEKKDLLIDWFKYRFIDVRYGAQNKQVLKLFKSLEDSWKQTQLPLKDYVESKQWHDFDKVYGVVIDKIFSEYNYIENLLLIDNDGNILYDLRDKQYLGTNVFSDFSDGYFTQSIKASLKGQTLFSDLALDFFEKTKLSGFITTPLKDIDNNVIGVFVLKLRNTEIFKYINKDIRHTQYNIRHYILGEDTRIRSIISDREDGFFKRLDLQHLKTPLDKDRKKKFSYINFKGDAVFSVYQTIDFSRTKWFIVSEIKQTLILSTINKLKVTEFWLFFIISFLSIILAFLKTNQIIRPLIALEKMVQSITAGGEAELLKVKGNTEISMLANAFNKMAMAKKQQYLSLKESEQQYLSILNQLETQKFALDQHVMLSISNKQGYIVSANDLFCKITGYEVDELVGQRHSLLNSNYHSDSFYNNLYQTLKRGGTWKGEIRNINKHGEFYWIDSTIFPFKDTDQNIINYMSINTDISSRKQYEFSLKENQERLELIMSNTGGGIWDWDVLNDIISVDKYFSNILGYTKAELKLFSLEQWTRMIHKEDIEDFNTLNFNNTEQESIQCEVRIKHKYGHWIWILISAHVMEKNQNGLILRVIGSLLDISSRKYTEIKQQQVLEEMDIKLSISRILAESLPLKVRFDNAIDVLLRFSDMSSYQKGCIFLYDDEKNKLTFHSGRGDMNLEYDVDNCKKVLKSRTITIVDNCLNHIDDFTYKDGHGHYIIPLKTNSTAEVDRIVGVLLLYTKVNPDASIEKLSLLKEIANIFVTSIMQNRIIKLTENARKEADESNKLKGEFLATMSHEIRTPMNGILGMSELLLDEPLTDQQKEHAVIIQKSARSLLTIISDILDFSKIEAGKLDLDSHDFDLNKIIKVLVDTHIFHAKRKGVSFISTINTDNECWYKSDSVRFSQILNNLINNALKFTLDGEVKLSCQILSTEKNLELVRFDIKDTGIGLTKSEQALLFKKFSQSDSSTTRKYGGTGLGLAICKELVTMMGGEIGVKSIKGEGSNFWFSLYLEKVSPPLVNKNTELSVIKSESLCQKDIDILVVDDNTTNQLVAVKLLEKLGYHADVVINGQDAMSLLAQKSYDIILMDCQMPVMDGYTATCHIRSGSIQPNVIIIAMTANVMSSDKEACLACGMNDFLSKPIDIYMLKNIIEKWSAETVSEDFMCYEDGIKTLKKVKFPVLDLKNLNERMLGDTELVTLVLETFLAQLPLDINLLKTCIDNEEYEACAHQAHKIKGSSGNAGATGLCDLSVRLENSAKLNDLFILQEIFWQFKQESDHLIRLLKDALH